MDGQQPVQLDFSKAQPIGQQQPAPQQGGVQLDFSKAQPIGNHPNPVSGVFQGIGEGMAQSGLLPTIIRNQGDVDWLHKIGGQGENESGSEDVGRGIEDIGEFLMGDEALSALPMSQKFTKIAGVMKQLEESPVLNRIFQAGVRALRGGAVGGAETAAKGGDAGDIAAGAASGAVGNAVVPEAIAGVKAIPGVVSKVVQAAKGSGPVNAEVQKAIQGILSDVANDHGVQPPTGALRDHAAQIGNALRDKGKAIYQELDAATGSKIQSYQEAVDKAEEAFNKEVDPAKKEKLVKVWMKAEEVKEAAFKQAAAKGADPAALKKADEYYKQGSALQDMGKKFQSATASEPDAITKFVRGSQSMLDRGRLQQALGSDERANKFVQTLREGKANIDKANADQKTVIGLSKTALKYAAGGAAGTLGVEAVRHVIGK